MVGVEDQVPTVLSFVDHATQETIWSDGPATEGHGEVITINEVTFFTALGVPHDEFHGRTFRFHGCHTAGSGSAM